MSAILAPARATEQRVGAPAAARDASYGWLGFGLVALGAGLAAVAFLGPLVFAVIDYRVTGTLRNQTLGLDAVSLALVAPLTIVVGVLALRRYAAAPALALGPAAYSAYMLLQYVLGPEYLRLPGNNERFFLLFLALFVLAGTVGLFAWNAIEAERLPELDTQRARLLSHLLLPLAGLFVFLRYIPALADAMSAKPSAGDYRAGPTFFWTIALLDLGIGLPTLITTCIGLQHRRAWAQKTLWSVVGWLALVGPAVAGMATAMYWNHDPNASLALLGLMSGLAVGLVALAIFVFRPVALRTSGFPPGVRR